MSSRLPRTTARERPENLAILLREAFVALNDLAVARIAARGHSAVRPAHGAVFQYLDDAGTTVSVLAERAQMTKQSMAELVRHLEAHGYVDRVPDPSDRRAKLVRATDRGREVFAIVREFVVEVEGQLIAALGARRMSRLRGDLEAVRLWADNPLDTAPAAAVDDSREDPWTMYYVVRKDRALTLGQAMSLAGAGALACADAWRDSPRWAAAFAAWHERSRKVALRADAAQFRWLRAALDCAAVDGPDGETLLCLPPRRKSEREPLLSRLRAYTEAPRPAGEPQRPSGMVMRYVVRAEVMKSMGKAMAQAGHAALMCADMLGAAHAGAFAAWRANDLAGEVLLGDDADWARVQAQTDCAVVRDAGLTQVAPGTETVLALVPAREPGRAVASLRRVD